MLVRRLSIRVGLVLATLFASVALLGTAGCSLPPALSKTELDSGTLPEKHPKVSAEKTKAGCRSCHREQQTKATD